MADAEQLNSFLVDVFGRINKIEERAMAGGLGSAVSITEIHIIEKIGDQQSSRMSAVAKAVGITLATLTVACDKLETKGLITRSRDAYDKRVVNVALTPRGQTIYEYHKQFHERMISAALSDLSESETAVRAGSLQQLQAFFENQGMI